MQDVRKNIAILIQLKTYFTPLIINQQKMTYQWLTLNASDFLRFGTLVNERSVKIWVMSGFVEQFALFLPRKTFVQHSLKTALALSLPFNLKNIHMALRKFEAIILIYFYTTCRCLSVRCNEHIII